MIANIDDAHQTQLEKVYNLWSYVVFLSLTSHFGLMKELVCTFWRNKRPGMHILEE